MHKRAVGILACGATLLLAVPSGAAEKVGSRPVKELLYPDHMDESRPLREMPVLPPNWDLDRFEHPVLKLPRRPRPAALRYLEGARDAATQAAPSLRLAATSGLNFDGVGIGLGGFSPNSAPPDTNGAIGTTQYVEWVNTSFAVFNKTTGAVVYGPAAGNTLWQGFGGPCATNNDGDPIALFDKAAQRWVMTQFSVTGGQFWQCIAVSTSADATGSYRRFSYSFTNFNDYPKVGIWPDGYYFSFNMFNAAGTAFLGGRACVADRQQMVTANGTPAPMQCVQLTSTYGGLLPSDLDGSTAPPAGSPNYFLAFDDVNRNGLFLWKYHADWNTPANSTFTGPTKVSGAAFTEACSGGTCIPQSGTTQKLDSLADRLMYRLAYRNFGTHESLVVNHSVNPGNGTSGVRWYEVRGVSGTPSVYQQGTLAPDASYRWMGSIAQDQSGNMLVGYSRSAGGERPSVYVTGRQATDPLGTLQAETPAFTGGGSQTGGLSRWGDYSAMTVDPVDDCTFWFTSEYLKANGSFNWSTRITSFKFPSCGGGGGTPDFSVSVAPASLSVAQGGTGSATVTIASINGFASTVGLSASGLPSGVTASFAPLSVTPPATATVTFTAGTAATVGTASVTLTGTSGSTTHSATLSLTVTSTGGGPVVVFQDGAESASSTFVRSNTTTSTQWTRQATAPYAGTYRWKAGSSTGGNYGNSGDARLTTPTLNLAGATSASLTYAFKHSTEANFDFFEVRISTDGGVNWTNLVRVSGLSAGWNGWAPPASINLNAYAGQTNVKVQFRLTTDTSVTAFGVAVDEVKITKQ